MAGLKIEGDLSQINDRQLGYIQSVIESKGFNDNKVMIEPVGKAGDNYVANVMRITVDDGKGGTLKMVAKIAPSHEVLRAMTNTELLFRNEHIMYMKVLPKLTQLEKAADIPPKDRLRYAACYGSLSEPPNEVIILEDLNDSNFIMLNRLEPLADDCVKSVLKNFALLHSLGFVLRNKEPELFEEFQNSLFDMWSTIQDHQDSLKYFQLMETGISMIVESDFHKKAISTAISRSIMVYGKIAIPDKPSKHSIIQQGDAWTNNIMFKFDGETLLESVMIDYQISKAGNPATDILYLIFNCTDYDTRKENFHDWIEYYHNELDKSLSQYGLKANYVYSKDQLDADLKRYGRIGFGQAILLSSILCQRSEEAGAMKDAMQSNDVNELMKQSSLSAKDPETLKLIKKKVEGIVDSYHELGLM